MLCYHINNMFHYFLPIEEFYFMKNIFTIQAPKAPSHVNAPKQQVDQ